MTLNAVTREFEDRLRRGLPADAFRPAAPHYFEDPRGLVEGRAGVILAPSNVKEVAFIVRHANEARVPVVPFGGGTGLVGGQLRAQEPAPVIVSLERMTAIRAVLPKENAMIAEAGAVLHDIHQAAAKVDRLFPLWLASEGSCRIGGNLATNAGGINVIRYGTARDLCLGLEAVLPNGEIWNGLRRLRKDNTGYDLKNLLIGAEGTLGIITAASLRLFPIPAAQGAALMVVNDPESALALLEMSVDRAAESLSAFELIDGTGLQFLAETMPHLRQPFAVVPRWMVLVDVGLPKGQDPTDLLGGLFEDAYQRGLVSDGLIAQSETQRSEFWSVRESIPAANKRIGAIASHDISLPIGAIPEFIAEASSALNRLAQIRINCFGHLGDGNLHFNVFPAAGHGKSDYASLASEIRRTVYDLVATYGGSFSAEHGVGRLKVEELERYGDPAKLNAMRAIKAALDPAGIMNPGAVLPA